MMNEKTYSLDEFFDRLNEVERLDVVHSKKKSDRYNETVNAFTEALSNMDFIESLRKEVYAMKGMDYPEDDGDLECPGIFEDEWRIIARRDKFRFYNDGRIASYDLYHK